MQLTIAEVCKVLNLPAPSDSGDRIVTGLCPVRIHKLQPGDLFFVSADMLTQANISALADKQIAGIITERADLASLLLIDVPVFIVDDYQASFWELVQYGRTKLKCDMIAITGSSGKTTTKELVASVLNQKYHVFKTLDNKNSLSYLSRNLFSVANDVEIAIWESGIDREGQLAKMSKIIQPDVGVITNIGHSHIGKFGSLKALIKAKGELIAGLKKEGTLCLNADDFNSQRLPAYQGRTIRLGTNPKADMRFFAMEQLVNGSRFHITYQQDCNMYFVPFKGVHNIYNALVAILLGYIYGLSAQQIQSGLNRVTIPGHRWEVIKFEDGSVLINDAYNANPESVQASLKTFFTLYQDKKRVVVLGDMLELGTYAENLHQKIGEFLIGVAPDYLVTCGPLAEIVAQTMQREGFPANHIALFDCLDDVSTHLTSLMGEGVAILLKGSHATKLFTIGDSLTKFFTKNR